MKWQKKLTKKELAHVKEWCGGTLASFKRNRKEQHEQEAEHPISFMPCFDCKMIARKLGIE